MTSVILILDPQFSVDVKTFDKFSNIWILDSLQNKDFIKNLLCRPNSVTWIDSSLDEKPHCIFFRILDSLDQHHNELAQKVPYDTLDVYGLDEVEGLMDFAREFGFKAEYRDGQKISFMQ